MIKVMDKEDGGRVYVTVRKVALGKITCVDNRVSIH